ncbi:unnamed protein product [Parascedosporium putredinis]|uniref:Uncharacterized protein n=1 Tax=Parascedosporium putredinis TaxID=1442378 RepID=A0A9P1MD50_9PEZI|nr:unnamed protein product [Parascedosporium putredinis]CAI7999748.1 unnamed protein product [Parascedosporium putredinis]
MTAQRPGPAFPSGPVGDGPAAAAAPGTRSWSLIYRDGFDYCTQRPRHPADDLLLGGGWARSSHQGRDAVGDACDDSVDVYTVAHLAGVLPAIFSPRWGPSPAPSCVWSGIIAVTGDGLPFVGRLPPAVTGRLPADTAPSCGDGGGGSGGQTTPPSAGEWIAAGYNGEGMVYAWLCASALAVMIAGKQDDHMPPRIGVPGGKMQDWFPTELFVNEARLRRATLSLDPALVFAPPPSFPQS